LALDTPVTIRQLLNHTSGLPDYGALPTYQEAVHTHPTHPWTDDDFLVQTLSNGLAFTPGQGWGYSNLGFLLLRQVVEVVTGNSFGTALHKQIIVPLGLQKTFVAHTLDDARHLTPGYSTLFQRDTLVQDVRSSYHPGWVAHGVVVSTAPELVCIIDSLFSGHLLTALSGAAMLEPVLVPYQHTFFQEPAYGLGVMIDPQSRYGLIAGHGGDGPGYSTGALHIPNVHGHRVTSIVLANRDQDDLGLRMAFTLAMTVADLL
jgi:D-alanyl-D-alanine carboxypeptidase